MQRHKVGSDTLSGHRNLHPNLSLNNKHENPMNPMDKEEPESGNDNPVSVSSDSYIYSGSVFKRFSDANF